MKTPVQEIPAVRTHPDETFAIPLRAEACIECAHRALGRMMGLNTMSKVFDSDRHDDKCLIHASQAHAGRMGDPRHCLPQKFLTQASNHPGARPNRRYMQEDESNAGHPWRHDREVPCIQKALLHDSCLADGPRFPHFASGLCAGKPWFKPATVLTQGPPECEHDAHTRNCSLEKCSTR
mgnify:CR=1 FL=1